MAALSSGALGLAVCTAGCSQGTGRDGSTPVDVVLTIGLNSGHVDVRPIVRSLTTQRLVGTAADGRATPGLLDSWTTSADGLMWDFYVRPGVRRHDGIVVTAGDVVKAIADQRADDPPAGLLDVDQLETVDPRHLRIHLRAPSSLLLEALTLTRAVPAGPFAVEPASQDASAPVVLRADDAAGDRGAVAITRVILERHDSPRAAWSALMRGEIDLLYEAPGEARPFLEQTPGVEVHSFLRPFVITLGLNARHPVLRHAAVRRALNHSVDRQEILDLDFGGRGLAAAGPVWPRHWAADASLNHYPFDASLARELLDVAGFPVKARVRQPHSRFRITCLIADDIPRLERVALRVRRAFAGVGVDLVLVPVAQATLASRIGDGDFEAFLVPVMSGYGPNVLYQTWAHDSPERYVDYGYTAAAGAAERLRRAHTDPQLLEAMRDMQRVLFDDPPAVFLIWEETARAVGRRFIVPATPGRDILATLARWRPSMPPAAEEAAP